MRRTERFRRIPLPPGSRGLAVAVLPRCVCLAGIWRPQNRQRARLRRCRCSVACQADQTRRPSRHFELRSSRAPSCRGASLHLVMSALTVFPAGSATAASPTSAGANTIQREGNKGYVAAVIPWLFLSRSNAQAGSAACSRQGAGAQSERAYLNDGLNNDSSPDKSSLLVAYAVAFGDISKSKFATSCEDYFHNFASQTATAKWKSKEFGLPSPTSLEGLQEGVMLCA